MAALIILLAIAALFSVFDLADEDSPLIPAMTLDFICLAVGLLPAVIQATRRRFDIFEPIHLVAAALTLITGVRALYLLTYRTAVYSRLPSDDLIAAALALSIVGMLAVYAGYYSGIGDNLGASMRPWRALWVGERRYPSTTIALAAVTGLASMAVLGNELASVEGQRSVLDAAGLFWLTPLSYCAPFALYMMLLNLEREPPNIARLIAFVSMLIMIGAFFLLRPSKDWVLRLFYYPLVFYHYRRGKLPAFKTALFGTIAIIGLFFAAVIGHFYVRRFEYDTADTVRFLNNNLENPREFFDLLLSRFYGIDAIAVIVEHVRQTGHFLMGSSLAEVLYWFVPRAVWPGKPFTFSLVFGQLFQSYVGWGGEAYASTTIFGELYLNFGLIGIIAGAFVFGVLIRLFYVYLIKEIQTKSAIMLYAILLIQSVEFTEGPIGAHVALAVSEAAPFLILLYVTWAASSFGRRARVNRGRR